MRSANSDADAPTSQRNPFTPCSMTSGATPVRVATGTTFDIIASMSGIGPPSRRDGETNTSMVS